MRRKLFVSMFMIALMAALVGGATFALFTDEATNSGNSFAAGTVDINSSITTGWTAGCDNMAPGDTKEAVITVVNNGSLELRYDVALSATGDLFTDQGQNGPATVTLERFVGGSWVTFTAGNNDFVLASGSSDQIKVIVNLPLLAGNAYQGDTGTVGLTFSAEQTINNP